jgi:hypothetical protein
MYLQLRPGKFRRYACRLANSREQEHWVIVVADQKHLGKPTNELTGAVTLRCGRNEKTMVPSLGLGLVRSPALPLCVSNSLAGFRT